MGKLFARANPFSNLMLMMNKGNSLQEHKNHLFKTTIFH